MQRDPRPVSQQVLSGLKIGAVLIAIGATVGAVLIGQSYIPVRIRAYIWHLRHGSTIDVARHRLPAPKQWYVEHISEDHVMMVDLNSGNVVAAWTSGLQGNTVSWSDLVPRASATSKTIKETGQREFHISGERFLCIEQEFELDVGAKVGHLNSIHCLSDGGLEVMFTPYLGIGKEHDAEFYILLQQIQKL